MQVFLETQRLVLRRSTLADVDNLVSLDAVIAARRGDRVSLCPVAPRR